MELNIRLEIKTHIDLEEEKINSLEKYLSGLLLPFCDFLGFDVDFDTYNENVCEMNYFYRCCLVYKISRDVQDRKNYHNFVSLFEALSRLIAHRPHVDDCRMEW